MRRASISQQRRATVSGMVMSSQNSQSATNLRRGSVSVRLTNRTKPLQSTKKYA